jgi:molybdopterin molybdotransferase
VAQRVSIDEARGAVLAAARMPAAEPVPVDEALGRVLAEPVDAAHDVPGHDNSAMDGFGVAAGPAGRRLRVAGESRAGAPATAPPAPGEALPVSTGALVPPGTEAVVPVEQTEPDGPGQIRLTAGVHPGQHVRRAGEDVGRGARVLAAGTALGPAELGVAVVAGRGEVLCAPRPRVALVSTGDELVAAGAPLAPGQLHDSNSVVLAALAARAGARVVARGRAHDTLAATERALAGALEVADVVVVSGGVSVGPHDHVKPALAALGVEEVFWRVRLRPGGPIWFGVRDDPGGRRLVFGLPGNPVSSTVTFTLFARPALLALQGADPAPVRTTARLAVALPRRADRDEAVRVALDPAAGTATPTGPQGSHVTTSMLGADGLAIVPAGPGELAAGAPVAVELLPR